jgi:hypothetical protein
MTPTELCFHARTPRADPDREATEPVDGKPNRHNDAGQERPH